MCFLGNNTPRWFGEEIDPGCFVGVSIVFLLKILSLDL